MAVGSAIGAIGSAVGGFLESDEADEALAMAEREHGLATESRDKGVKAIEGNQANVDALQEFMNSMGDKGVEFAQGLLDDWEGTFGGIQDNLSDYYNNLDPDKFSLQSKVKFADNMQKQLDQYNETFKANGMQSAGMRAQTAKEAMFKTAETNAQIDINAPEQVAQMKEGFLKFGDPQRAGAQNAMSKGMDNQARFGEVGYNAQTQQAGTMANTYFKDAEAHDKYAEAYGASAAGHSDASGNMFGSAIKMGLDFFS